ncbi:3427_t:CDS:2, partial [Cetraspora pellucida]
QIKTHLEDFSLYEKHYNQPIASDFFRQILSDLSLSKSNMLMKLKLKLVKCVQISKETCDVGVQVSDAMSYILENYIYLLQAQLNTKINKIENLQKQLEYAYNYIIESWKHIQEVNKINKELSEQNDALKHK